MSDLKVALNSIVAKRPTYERADTYYEGDQPEIFANAHLRRLLSPTADDYRLNFAATVVDAVANRLEIAAVVGTSDEANGLLNEAWEHNELMLEANEVHKRALVFGDCYVIVWPDEDGHFQIGYNSPENVTLVYDAENPRRKAFGAKVWSTGVVENEQYPTADIEHRLNLYYADRIEKYEARGTEFIRDAQWTHFETLENPFGEVPVFHFRTARPYGKPEHLNAYGPQDAINKLVSVQMNTVDYQGAPQRYALANNSITNEITDFEHGETDRENLGALENGPGELWYLKGVDEVGQFDPADPQAFLAPLKDYIRAMASLTATPLHYFERTGNVPSGEALRVAEAPLLKKVQDRQVAFSSAWREVFSFILRANGRDEDVQVRWQHVESTDSLDTWDVALKKLKAGLPLKRVLVEMGYDLEVVQEIVKDIDKVGQILKETNDGYAA